MYRIFVPKRNIAAVKRVEFLSNRISYIILAACWCDVLLNAHATTKDKIDHLKHSFYEERERVFDEVPKFFDWLYSPCRPWTLFSLLICSQSVGPFGRVISSSQGHYLNTGQHKHRINKYTHQTSIP
jgi:hypothetical protein